MSENVPFPLNNGAILNVTKIIKAMMSSLLGVLYINMRKAVKERQILKEMGHPQPQRRYKLTIQPQKESSIARCSPSTPKQWTCGSTGCGIGGKPTAIPFLLEAGDAELRGLLDKAPPPSHH